MNIGIKLFENFGLTRVTREVAQQEALVLPLLPGQTVEAPAGTTNLRDLIERLCFERFRGAVYFQGEDERGPLVGVALIEDDALTSALLWAGQTQWVGAAAWTLMCALESVPECLTLRVETPLIEAYSALLRESPSATTSADARRLNAAAVTFGQEQATGTLRVTGEGQTLLQFFSNGESLGVYTVDPDGQLLRRAEGFAGATLPRRARLEVWKREARRLYRSPSPFDGARTLALARFLQTAFELGIHLIPRETALANWHKAVEDGARAHPFLTELTTEATLDLSPEQRLRAWSDMLRAARQSQAELACGAGEVVDAFLLPIAQGVGETLFAARTVKAWSSADRALLQEMNVPSRWLSAEAAATAPDEAGVNRVLEAVVDARFSKAPRRIRSEVSTYDF